MCVMKMNNLLVITMVLFAIIGLSVWLKMASTQSEVTRLSTGANADEIRLQATATPNSQNNIMKQTQEMNENPTLVMQTTLGEITIELFMDSTPLTAENFLSLAKEGFYDGIKFHRVIPGFMIQGGDPNTKGEDETTYGTGGPGYSIKDEFVSGLSNVKGTLSMANAGPNTGGSQFFINTADNTFLDGKHAVFGRVIAGLETVTEIESTETKERDIPVTPVTINQITLTNDEV
jgi:peptidylprolyl isomerase